jgi:hypothetical protein
MRLTRNPVPWTVTAPKVIANEFISVADFVEGRASIKFEANGAASSIGYAGKIQIGVMLCTGNDLVLLDRSSRFRLGAKSYCVDHNIRYITALPSILTAI